MKKIVSLMVTAFLAVQCLMAQVSEGIRHLDYEKYKSARTSLKAAYDANSKDPQVVYWYGQALIVSEVGETPKPEDVNSAKEVYQKGIQDIPNDPLLVVGLAHIELLQGGDINSIKQKFEQAITTATDNTRKFKGRVNGAVLNAIGRANASVGADQGDHVYAIEKLKLAAEQELAPADIFVNMGINHLRMGGENGGEAVKAFSEAASRDTKNARALYRIGKIYQSQNNKELFEEFFNKAIAADPAIAPVYFSLYTYYAEVSTVIAKTNLDLFLQYADKDPIFEYFSADYLFRSGQFDQSLEKAKAMEAAGSLTIFPGLAVLLAKNYDKKGDTVLARSYIEPYITNTTPDKLINTDYEIAVKILSKFSGSQATLAVILEKAIAADTAKVNKLKYYKLGYEMLEKNNMYTDELKWYANYSALRGVKDEVYYYKTTSIAINAKEGAVASTTAKEYIATFPDKPNGYSMNVRAARLLDTANNLGILFEAVNVQNEFLLKDLTKNKQALINNYYTLIGYYNETKSYENAVLMCDKVLEIVPEDPTTLQAKGMFIKNIDIIKKMQNSKGGVPAPPLEKPAADTTQIKKG